MIWWSMQPYKGQFVSDFSNFDVFLWVFRIPSLADLIAIIK